METEMLRELTEKYITVCKTVSRKYNFKVVEALKFLNMKDMRKKGNSKRKKSNAFASL